MCESTVKKFQEDAKSLFFDDIYKRMQVLDSGGQIGSIEIL